MSTLINTHFTLVHVDSQDQVWGVGCDRDGNRQAQPRLLASMSAQFVANHTSAPLRLLDAPSNQLLLRDLGPRALAGQLSLKVARPVWLRTHATNAGVVAQLMRTLNHTSVAASAGGWRHFSRSDWIIQRLQSATTPPDRLLLVTGHPVLPTLQFVPHLNLEAVWRLLMLSRGPG